MKDEARISKPLHIALNDYLQALAWYDPDLRGILNARFCGPSAFDDEVFSEAIARLADLHEKVKAGT